MAADLSILVTLKDKASRALDKIRGKAKALGGAVGKVMRAGVLAGGVALAGLGVAAIKFGTDFKKAEDIIRAGTGATGEALDALYEDFKATFAEVPADMKDVAQATADLNTRLGLTGEPLQTLAAQFLELSRITKTDVATNIRLGTRVLGDWSVATEDSAEMLDYLFKVSQTTGVSMDKLQTGLVSYGAPLRMFGFGVKEAAVLMGKWEKEGVATEKILGALQMGVSKFARAGIPLKEGLQDLITEITKMGMSSEAVALASEYFGTRAGPDMAAAIAEGRFALEDYTAAIEASDETIMKVGEDTMTWQEKLKLLRNRVLVKLEPVLVKFVDLIGELADWLGEKIPLAMDLFIGGFEEGDVTCKGLHGRIEKFGVAARRFLDAVIPVVKELGKAFIRYFGSGLQALKPLFNFIVNNKVALVAAIAAIGIAIVLALGPVGTAMVAITAFIVILGIFREHWDEIKAKVTEAVDSIIAKIEGIPVIGEIFKATVRVVQDKIKAVISAMQGLIDFAKELINFFKAIFRGDWAAAWDSLKEMAKIALRLFLDWLQLTFVGTIRSILRGLGLWDAAKGAFETFKTKASSFLSGVVNTVRGIGSDIAKALGDGLRAAKGYVTGALNAIITAVEKGANFLIRGINNLMAPLRALGAAFGAALSFFGLPSIPTIPPIPYVSIPRLHKGGEVIRSGLAEVREGERYSRGGGNTYVFNFTHSGTLMGNEAEAERFAAMIDARLRRKWRRQYA
ncbi:MAG: phage tail tape measure protein [Dehalococcoidia bacterium]|nr:MAG: phage tail tape measure protein [Dehalococcoidia bacterium]